MNSDDIWKPKTGVQWLQSLALPAKPWVKPFLQPMQFPVVLANNSKIFQDIHAKALEQRTFLWHANKEVGYVPELDVAITREVVTSALEEIKNKTNLSVAESFKDWAYRNFIDDESISLLLAWRVVLRHACGQGNPLYTLIPPPQSLSILLPKIVDQVSYEKDQAVYEKLYQLAPPYEDQENMGLDISPEVMTVEEIIRNESTRDALQYIFKNLSELDLEKTVIWANSQSREQEIEANLSFDVLKSQ